jgi:hypothetical protein
MSFIKRIYKAFMHGPIYIILFGMVFYGIGAGLTYRQRSIERQGIEVPGEVVSFVQSCDNDGCTYAPVVRFQTQDGRSVSYESTFSSSPPAYDKGEIVQIFYSPENPEKAVIKGEGRVLRLIFTIVGSVIIIFGLGTFGTNVRDSFAFGEDIS